MKSTEKIQRVTSKGQITLPVSWRRKMGNLNSVVVRIEEGELRIAPLRTEDERDAEWVTLFDAVRDNGGKGIPAKKFADAIRRANKKHERD